MSTKGDIPEPEGDTTREDAARAPMTFGSPEDPREVHRLTGATLAARWWTLWLPHGLSHVTRDERATFESALYSSLVLRDHYDRRLVSQPGRLMWDYNPDDVLRAALAFAGVHSDRWEPHPHKVTMTFGDDGQIRVTNGEHASPEVLMEGDSR